MNNPVFSRIFQAGGVYLLGVLGIHALGITLLALAMARYPQILGMGLLAYSFGLRHAFDIDHIAAIDNTVRKMSQVGQKSHGVGFWFSLGHSTVVLLLSCGMGLAASFVAMHLSQWKEIGGVIGTSVSGIFLILIGVINLLVWIDILRLFGRLRRGETVAAEEIQTSGALVRLFQPLFRFIRKGWHLFPIGFLFGLGFDTASEVAVLALSSSAGAQAMSWIDLLALPVLFAAGMSLLDTTDGIFMTRAYSWAFSIPLKKVFYNATMTGLSVVVAIVIGVVELLQVVTPMFGLNAGIWKWVQDLDFSSLGYFLVGAFGVGWALALGAWKFLKLDVAKS